MTLKTAQKLDESIAIWEGRTKALNPSEVNLGHEYCPLCPLFRIEGSGCDGCPVSAQTGQSYCKGSPYEQALVALQDWRDYEMDDVHYELRRRFRNAARSEVRFLKSLRRW